MKKMHRKEGGFTLVEILIVLALLGILLAVVIPNLTGFLGRGKDESYRTDSRTIQAAVDAYYTDTQKRPGARKWPNGADGDGTCVVANASDPATFTGSAVCTELRDAAVNMTDLKNEGYLRDVPQSASATNAGGTAGSYTWFVHNSGVVSSDHEATSTRGYISGVYP